jgi:membrane protein YdbS with pleckstrin-like domain
VSQVRRPLGGAVGDDPDPTDPEIRRDAAVLVEDDYDDDAELYDVGAGPYPDVPLRERMGEWRKRLLPLPDEVVHEYLGEDEYVIHTDHPSFRAFLIQNAIQVGILTVAAVAFLILARIEINWTTLAVFLVLDVVFAILALKRLSERYISYVITNLRLIRVAGIVGRKISSIPWTRMTGIGYRQTAMGRFLGYATIHLESANEESGLREFSDINDPATFHQHLLNMVSSKTGQSSDSGLPPPPTKGVRKTFMQRRRERKETMERAARFELERERQARDRARQDAVARVRASEDDDQTEEDVLADLAPSTPGEPAPPRDRGGAYEGMSTPEANAPDRPPTRPGRRRPPMAAGERRPEDRGPGDRGPRGRRPGDPGPGDPRPGAGRSRPPKRRPGAPAPGGAAAPDADHEAQRAAERADELEADERPRATRRRRPPSRERPVPGGDPSTGDTPPGGGVWRPSPEKGRRPPPEKRRRSATDQPRGRPAPAPRARPTPKARPSMPPVKPDIIDVTARTGPIDAGDEAQAQAQAPSARRSRRFWPGADQGPSQARARPEPPAPEPARREPAPREPAKAETAQPEGRRGLRLPKVPRVRRRTPPSTPAPDPGRRAASDDDAEALGGLSARDALGSVRKSTRQRPPPAARPTRPRRPTFGRGPRPEVPPERPEPSEPRELPPASTDPSAEVDDEGDAPDAGTSGDDTTEES